MSFCTRLLERQPCAVGLRPRENHRDTAPNALNDDSASRKRKPTVAEAHVLSASVRRYSPRGVTVSKPRLDSEHLFRLMVANIRDYAIFMLDPDGRIATWNAGAERITGYKADEAIGKHLSIFYPQVDIDAGKCDRVLGVAEREGHFDEEGWRLCKDGTPFWASCVLTAVRDDSGALLGYSKITRDLT